MAIPKPLRLQRNTRAMNAAGVARPIQMKRTRLPMLRTMKTMLNGLMNMSNFSDWWSVKGLAEYEENCRLVNMEPSSNLEHIAKHCAWAAYIHCNEEQLKQFIAELKKEK